jgi:hypothetical protein
MHLQKAEELIRDITVLISNHQRDPENPDLIEEILAKTRHISIIAGEMNEAEKNNFKNNHPETKLIPEFFDNTIKMTTDDLLLINEQLEMLQNSKKIAGTYR